MSDLSDSIADRSLLVLIVDLTSTIWGERHHLRDRQDRERMKEKKRSRGPGTLKDIMSSIQSFILAYASLHRENCAVIIGVSGNDCATLYPRKGQRGGMDAMVGGLGDNGGTFNNSSSKIDVKEFNDAFLLGVAELIAKSTERYQHLTSENGKLDKPSSACIAAATSLALLIINRFLVASNGGGVSAIGHSMSTSSGGLLHRKEDDGILSMIASKVNNSEMEADKATEKRLAQRRARGILSPRILILQASEDCSRDYNAFMNCVFAACKNDIVIDGCYISGGSNTAPSSTFLEQACDRTGGVFTKPTDTTQIGGMLTEILMTVFLPPLGLRRKLNLPRVNQVDFRARCFESGESVDLAYACNLCLSIFKEEPLMGSRCPTCGALYKTKSEPKAVTNDGEKSKGSVSSKRPRLNA